MKRNVMESSILSQGSDDRFEPEAFLKSIGKAVTLLLLPYLLAFLFRSNDFLRTYIALLAAPNPDVHPAEPEKNSNSSSAIAGSPTHKSKWRTLSAILVLSILSATQFGIIILQSHPQDPPSEVSPKLINFICQFAGYEILFLSVVLLTFMVSYPGKFVVHRTSNGQFVYLKLGDFAAGQPAFLIYLLLVSIGIFAYLMVAGISSSNNSLSVVVVTTACVALSTAIMIAVPLRRLIIGYSCFITAIVPVLIKYADASIFKSEEHESVWTSNIFENLSFAFFLPATVGSIWIGSLITNVLRFDASKHRVTGPDKTISYESVTYHPSSPDATVWTQMNPDQRLGVGIVIPETPPYAFPKPYHTLALTTWSLTRFTTLALCLTKIGFPTKSVYDACALGIFFEFPILVIVLFTFAAMRGEARDLWNFKWEWCANLTPSASSLERGEALLDSDEDKVDGKILV